MSIKANIIKNRIVIIKIVNEINWAIEKVEIGRDKYEDLDWEEVVWVEEGTWWAYW